MKNLVLALVLALTSLISNSAHAESYGEWRHINLKSRQGAEINLDYRVSTYSYYGRPVQQISDLWIHVSKSDLRPDSKVLAILINHSYVSETPHSETYDLKFVEGHFMVNGTFADSVFNASQEIAVVIDGEWQKASFDRDYSNFIFSFLPFVFP